MTILPKSVSSSLQEQFAGPTTVCMYRLLTSAIVGFTHTKASEVWFWVKKNILDT